jgi:hypothetical protein
MTLAMLCEHAIALWEKASGVPLHDAASIFSMDPDWNPKHVSRTLSQLRALPYGEQLCLNALAAHYSRLSEHLQLLTHVEPERIDAHIQLGKLLSSTDTRAFLAGAKNLIAELLQRFRSVLCDAEWAYIDSLPLQVLQDADQSFLSMKKVQWSSGVPVKTLNYNNAIPLFCTIQQLTDALPHMPHGFTLNAILTDNPADSYFVLVFKSGDNIVLLSDMPSYADPVMSSRLSSRNQRYNADRIQKSYLPYELLSLQWTDNDRRVEVKSTLIPTSQLSPGTTRPVLGFIAALPLDSQLWLSRVATLCVERYIEQGNQESTVSLFLPKSKESATGDSNTPMTNQSPTRVDLPIRQQLTREKFSDAFPEAATRGGHRQWMEEAYGKDIPLDVLYPVEEKRFCALPAPNPATNDRNSPTTSLSVRHDPMPLTLLPLPRQKIYTAEEAGRAALYIGRHNLAAVIEGRALQDFAVRRDKVIAWVYQRIINNLPALIPSLVSLNHDAFSMHQHPGACRILEKTALVRQVHFVKCKQRWIKKASEASTLIRRARLLAGHEACCYLQKHLNHTEVHSDHRFILNLSNIFDLMNVTGLPRGAFPDCLQHYGLPKNLGNTLLSTIDPLDLILDPWNKVVFTFSLPVSRTAVNQHRKTLGLKALPDAASLPHYWQSSAEASSLYDSLHQTGHKPVMVSHAPSYIHHESSDQSQVNADALNQQRRFVYEIQQDLVSPAHALPLVITDRS